MKIVTWIIVGTLLVIIVFVCVGIYRMERAQLINISTFSKLTKKPNYFTLELSGSSFWNIEFSNIDKNINVDIDITIEIHNNNNNEIYTYCSSSIPPTDLMDLSFKGWGGKLKKGGNIVIYSGKFLELKNKWIRVRALNYKRINCTMIISAKENVVLKEKITIYAESPSDSI